MTSKHYREDLRQGFVSEYHSQLIYSMYRPKMTVARWGVVLVGCDDKRRMDCPICMVTALLPGEDNVLRVVKVV
jgi:hypothetical protein